MLKRVITILIKLLWAKLSAPLIYPIWWQLKEKLCKKYEWKVIKEYVDTNRCREVKESLKNQGKLFYFLWTYGDLDDPLGRGGLPERYGKNTFWHRYRYSALRNPRFNWNYIELKTEKIIETSVVKNTRDSTKVHKMNDIGDAYEGVFHMRMRDSIRSYFIYEKCTPRYFFYIGWVGIVKTGDVGRFECSLRFIKNG